MIIRTEVVAFPLVSAAEVWDQLLTQAAAQASYYNRAIVDPRVRRLPTHDLVSGWQLEADTVELIDGEVVPDGSPAP